MNLIKTGLLNGIAVSIKLLTLLGLNKILALYVGPEGYAIVGQFQNAIQVLTSFASCALSTGVTKYTAEYHDNEKMQHTLWKTATCLAAGISILTGLMIFIFNKWLALFFLKNEFYGHIFIWFACTLIFFVFNTLFLAIVNGKRDLRRYIIANILGNLFSFLITSVLALKYGLYGVLLSLSIVQSVSFFVTISVCYKVSYFKPLNLFGKIDFKALKYLIRYALMAIVSAITLPISYMLVRNHLGMSLGWDAAGYWEAMSRLSAAYLMFVTTTLSIYYLPRLSELQNKNEIKAEIVKGYQVILPVSIICSIIIYLSRHLIVSLLFSSAFTDVIQLFKWQLMGDTFKIASWLLAYNYVAKGFLRLYIGSELLFASTFYFFVIVLTNHFGLQGVAMAHALNYLLYLIFVFSSLKYIHFI